MRLSAIAASVVLLTACAGTPPKKPASAATTLPAAPAQYTPPCAALPPAERSGYECDRRSILAMAGEFRVRFVFDETAALAPGYQPKAPQRSGGTELVEVVRDDGDTIVLQHILVMKMGEDVHVIKHWRQDWHYQPASLLRYRGNGRFETEALDPATAAGAWSQVVYEVDDAPRYAGIGRWRHEAGVDAWESDLTRRPLPRREFTKRSDYQALDVVNRHTLTPAGWVHEQDNTKLVLHADGSEQALAREHGVNSYTRITDHDFGPGREYWRKTQAYWADVRAEWARGFALHPSFVLSPEPNGEARIGEFFAQAERAGNGETIGRAEIDAVLTRYGLALDQPKAMP